MQRRTLSIFGAGFLLAWAAFWALNVYRDKVTGARFTSLPCWNSLGCDFGHNYHAARHWLDGHDPYQSFPRPDQPDDAYTYPPIVLPLFAWCGLFEERTATAVWMTAIAIIGAVATWLSCRLRHYLGLSKVPFIIALTAVLWSYPVLFAVERGNCDALALLMLICGVASLRRRTLLAEILAGLCLALAVWIKIYPGILVPGLLAVGRWRVAGMTACFATAIGLADLPGILAFGQNLRGVADVFGVLRIWSHSLTSCWAPCWEGTPLAFLGLVPGPVVWTAVVLPQLGWLSVRLWHCPERDRLLYPWFLWLVSAATYLPAIANDYNLIYLPCLLVAVWDRRDPWLVHGVILASMLWWMPIGLPVDARLYLAVKVGCLMALTLSLSRRAAEQTQHIPATTVSAIPALCAA